MAEKRSAQEALFQRARDLLPGGVDSPVRAFGAVGGTPRFIVSGKGARIRDADGAEYIDYVGAWGPAILGHAHPAVIEALKAQLDRGVGFGAPHEAETELAEIIRERMPSLQRLRFVNSGTEAAMSAVRLARAATGREHLLKFVGGYHGHADALLVDAGSGALKPGRPSSAGVPAAATAATLSARYNDLDSVRAVFEARGGDIACVLVEPVAGNISCLPPVDGFLAGLRDLCSEHGALLIFDEVMTGFRVGPGGAQARFGITPDLTVLGKVIGGGLPVGAFGGGADLMEQLAPLGPVYQAGTLSGNPLAMRAGVATLRQLDGDGVYAQLENAAAEVADGIRARAADAGIDVAAQHVGGMFGLLFCDAHPVRHYEQVVAADAERFRRFFHAMLDEGVYLAPSPQEAGFISVAHDAAVIDETLNAAERVFAKMNRP